MGYSRFDVATRHTPAWNAGKNVGTERLLTISRFGRSPFISIAKGDRWVKPLFDLAIDNKPRGCDLVKIKISEVVAGAEIRNRATVIQQKTNRPEQIELTAVVRTSLQAWLERVTK